MSRVKLIFRLPLHYEMLGKHEKQSRIVRGVVSTLHSDMQTVAQDLTGKELRILVRNCHCILMSTHYIYIYSVMGTSN